MYSYGIGNFNFGLFALKNNQNQVATSLERLSTGKQINRASDDPSGVIAAEKHKAKIYSIESQLKAFSRQESFLGAKEGGLSVISDQLLNLNGLVISAANTAGNSEAEQDAIQQDIRSIVESLGTIASTTTFNGQQILSEYSAASLSDTRFTDDEGNEYSLTDLAELAFKDPELAQEIAQDAVDSVASTRAAIGTKLSEIDSERSVLEEELIQLSDSLSSIEDVDYAKESAKLVRAQILESASIKAIEVSRQSANQVLSLLETATELSS